MPFVSIINIKDWNEINNLEIGIIPIVFSPLNFANINFLFADVRSIDFAPFSISEMPDNWELNENEDWASCVKSKMT